MELTTCAFVVTLVSLVTATPYGYGVKGGAGASARAESSASAGAFGGQGDIPVAIPFGNGFSGSFSKSSSSSSASSSSSSSSSSFSYSGSGAGGFSAQGTHGNIGCTSGPCQNSGGNEISGNHGTTNAGLSAHGLNTANAAAAAGSGSGLISGTDCNGPTCDGNSGKCLSGKCQPKIQTENGYDNSKKCISGQCGSPSETGPSAATNDDSDDIRFVAHSSKAAHDSKDQSADHDKLTGYSAGSDCRGGNCGTTTSYNSQPNSVHGAPNSYQHSKPSSLPPSTNLNTGSTPGYHTPATDLETPKYDSNCKSGICNSGQPEPVHGTSPSSYNVPIHGTYDTSRQKPACTDGKCNNQVKGDYYSTTSNTLLTNYLSSQESQSPNGPSYDNQSSKKCGEAGCGSLLSNQVTDRPSVTGATNIHSALPLSNSAALIQPNPTNCNTLNCNPHHIASASSGPNVQPTQINLSAPAHNIKPSNDKLPVYTGGFGAPAGILKPNDYSIPATGPSSPSYTHSSTALNIKPTFGSSPTGCISPNCLGQAPTPGAAPSSSYNTYKPSGNVNIPGQKLPTYTGGFGGPTGMLKPNEFNIATPSATKPNHSTSSTYNTPSVSTGCNTPNCIGSSPTSGVIPPVTAQPGSYGVHKESGNVPIVADKTPTYTAGFGGPAGMLKPDEFDVKVTNKPVHSLTPSYQNHPHIPTTGCKTPNCNGYAPVAGANAAANAQSGSYGAAKPSSDVDSSSELPPYTGSFGGPTGVLKPNEFGLPHSAPNSNNPNYSNTLPNKAPTSNNLAGCTTANCYPSNFGSTTATHPQSPFGATQPSITSHQSGVTSPGYTSNFARPVGIANPTAPAVAPISPTYTNTQPLHTTAIHSAGCKTGNCGGQPTSAGFPNGDHPSGLYGPANPNNEPKPYNPQYTAGFGSPSGTVTPNDHSYNVPSAGSSAINCKTANCANIPSAGAGSNTQSDFIAGTKEQLPAFSSGFGSPAGSFNDYSISAAGIAPNNHNKPSSVTSSPGACAAGNCDPKVTSPSLPGYNSAPSGSHSSSHPYNPQYTGGFGVPAGTATPDDYSHNLPSAGSSSIHCNTPNCANPAPTTAGANAQSGYNVGSKEQLPAYTSGFGAPAGLYKPNDHSIPDVGTALIDQNKPSAPGACSSGNCNPKVTSPSSPGYNSAPSSTLPSSQSSNPQYTGNFGSPSGAGSPNDHTYNVPSAASSSIPCKTSNCANPPTANAGANAQSASHAGSKEQLPAYTGGFGAPGGFLKPNDNSIPAVGAASNVHNKSSPATTAPGACSSGNCNSKVPLSSSPGYNPTSSGAHASASSVASAVAYTGGFGGPPGFLKPNDDGKVDLTKIVDGQNQGSHHGAGNIHSPHDLFNASTAGKAGAHSSAGATAYSGSLASANSGAYGFNTHGAHQAGGVKGTSPCGGGCGGGYQDGLNGGGSSAGAVARSHSGSGAFGIGGSFASSSASAHSSAGAYTKGGYGKR